MPWTAASTKRVVRKNARIGKEQWRASSAPEQTSNSSGVIRMKLSRLTRMISTSRRRLHSRSRWRAMVTPEAAAKYHDPGLLGHRHVTSPAKVSRFAERGRWHVSKGPPVGRDRIDHVVQL